MSAGLSVRRKLQETLSPTAAGRRIRQMRDWHAVVAPLSIVAAVSAVVVVGNMTSSAFLTKSNWIAILDATSVTGIVALGMTFITLSGSFFSLSIEQTAALSGITFAALMSNGYGVGGAFIITLLMAGAIGVVQGLVVASGLNPVVTTLGAGATLYGVASVATGNTDMYIHSTSANWIGQAEPLGIPIQAWTFFALTLVASLVLLRTRFGKEVMLVGASRSAARASGLRVGRVTTLAFTLSALASGLAGIFAAAQFDQATVIQFNGLNFDVIAAVLVGGAALQGGEGSALRSAVGALFIGLLGNLMLLRNASFGARTLVTGAVVVIATSAFHVIRTRNQMT